MFTAQTDHARESIAVGIPFPTARDRRVTDANVVFGAAGPADQVIKEILASRGKQIHRHS